MYGMERLLAARNCSQLQERRRSRPQGSIGLTKKLSGIVDTIDLLSNKHCTMTPPIKTSIHGQSAINRSIRPGCESPSSPSEPRLCSSAGTGFPTGAHGGKRQPQKDDQWLSQHEDGREPAPHHTRWHSDPAVDTCDKSTAHYVQVDLEEVGPAEKPLSGPANQAVPAGASGVPLSQLTLTHEV